MHIANPIDPDLLPPAERLAELGELLARGVMRLHAPKSSELSPDHGESSLDFIADQSGPEPATAREKTRK